MHLLTYKTKEDLASYYLKLGFISAINFTPREVDLMSCIINGRTSYKEIASILSIAIKSVETNKNNINRKLRTSNTNIRDFLEKSDKYTLVKSHYIKLVWEYHFKKAIEEINSIIEENFIKEVAIFAPNGKEFINFAEDLKSTLKKVQIKPNVRNLETIKKTSGNSNSINIVIFDNTGQDLLNFVPSNTIIILLKKAEIDKEYQKHKIEIVDFSKNFYFGFMDLLQRIFVNPRINKQISNFKNECLLIEDIRGKSYIQFYKNGILLNKENPYRMWVSVNKKKIMAFLTLVLCIVFLLKFFLLSNLVEFTVSSEFMIPAEYALIERSNITSKIKDILKGDGIRKVALVGNIGSGKSIAAKYYCKYISKDSVIWELNASDRKTLLYSLKELSHNLAETNVHKKTLEQLQQPEQDKMKEKGLLNFIKDRLQNKTTWLLLYDNLSSLSDVRDLIPDTVEKWGNGKVIITTRNDHIYETGYINFDNVIFVDGLDEIGKKDLFSRILYDKKYNQLNPNDKKNSHEFLKNVPPFPSDVFVAAFSIKNTYVTFDQYIKNMDSRNEEYENLQNDILKEISSNVQIRNKAIEDILNRFMNINKNLRDQMIFLCCLESNKITYDLLQLFSMPFGTETLIYHLRTNGLLTGSEMRHNNLQDRLYLHWGDKKSVEAFISKLSPQEKEYIFNKAILTFQNYYNYLDKRKDFENLSALVPHMQKFYTIIKTQKIRVNKDLIENFEVILNTINYGINSKLSDINKIKYTSSRSNK